MPHKKAVVDVDVITLARQRMTTAFDRYDRIVVSFSGGKDSTVVLNLALDEARKRQRVPLEVIFWDEEAIHPETVEYVNRVRQLPDVAMRWLCLPIKHRNACSRKHPYWHCWAEEDRGRWCRDLPPWGLTERDFPAFNRGTVPESNGVLFPVASGTVCVLMGIRADESLRRYRSVAQRVHDNWLAQDKHAKHVILAKPVYDWTTRDVWTAPKHFGWDYNRAYDVMTKLGITRHAQRVCPPYGEEPLRGLWWYAQAWPDLWERMINRVPGAATAARYSRSPVYGSSDIQTNCPLGMTWQEAIQEALQRWPASQRVMIAKRIKQEIGMHVSRSGNVPIPDVSDIGLSWSFLYKVAVRGDLKVRKSVPLGVANA